MKTIQHQIRAFTIRYLAGLSLIALLSLAGYEVLRLSLRTQSSDAPVINLSGRQRMLSQKLTRELLQFISLRDSLQKIHYKQRLKETLTTWKRVHRGLQSGDPELGLPGKNSQQIQDLFQQIEPYFQNMSSMVQAVLSMPDSAWATLTLQMAWVDDFLKASDAYLSGMDHIVFQYAAEARDRVQGLRRIAIVVTLSILGLLILEALLIFQPMIRSINRSYQKFLNLNRQLQKDIERRKQAEQTVQQNVKLQRTINGLLQISLDDIPLKTKLEQALEIIFSFFDFLEEKKGAIFLADHHNNCLNLVVSRNFTDAHRQECAQVPFEKCLCGMAVVQCQMTFTRVTEEHTPLRVQMHGSAQCCHIPIFSDRLLGILVIYARDERPFLQEYEEYLGAISHTLAELIEHCEAETELKQQLLFEQGLNRVSETIIQALNSRKVLETLIGVTEEVFRLDHCHLFEVHWVQKHIRKIGGGKSAPTTPDKDTGQDWVFAYLLNLDPIFRKEPYYRVSYPDGRKRNKPQDLFQVWHRNTGSKTTLWYPFYFGEESYLVLVCDHLKRIHHWKDAELNYLQLLCRFVETALEKIRLVEQQQRIQKYEIRKLATLIQQIPVSIILTDERGVIQFVNPAFTQITGYSPEEAIGRRPNILKSGKHDQQFYQSMWQKITAGQHWRGVLINRKKDGSEYYCENLIFPIVDAGGKIVNYVAISQDITRQKKMEDQIHQMQKMESIGLLAGGIAHDFNNLLTVINGYAQLAAMRLKKNHPLYPIVKEILQAGQRAENLTGQLLAFSRKQPHKPEVLNINEVISSLYPMLRRLISEDIQIETVLAEGLPNIKADKSQIEQILINLIVNAQDAIHALEKPPPFKKILIETGQAFFDKHYVKNYPHRSEGHYVYFAITDNGIGMDEEIKAHIFEPFFTTKKKHQGTGLGLSTVYGIVKQNSGHIDVYSEPGKGSTFKIYWPVVQGAVKKKKEFLNQVRWSGREKILVVEDDPAVRKFAVDALISLGYEVVEAANGRAALELLKNGDNTFDVIITDMVMPEMNGKEFAEIVKKQYPNTKIIFASGYTDNFYKNGVLSEDMHFLPKPYYIHTLARAVRKVLDTPHPN